VSKAAQKAACRVRQAQRMQGQEGSSKWNADCAMLEAAQEGVQLPV